MSAAVQSWSGLGKPFHWGRIAFWSYLLLLVVLWGTSLNPADPDLWQRFALFDYICRVGHFPPGDIFSYDSYSQVVPDHEWGAAFIFYPVYFWGGGWCLVLLKLITLGATLVLTVRAALGDRSPTLLETFFFSLVLLALLSSMLSTMRAANFTHLFFALWVFWFQRERRGKKTPVWAYILTMILWANLHGGFILGLAWLAVIAVMEFFTGRDWKGRALLCFFCLLATLVNPFGYMLWPGVYDVLFVPRPGFPEWERVSWFHDIGTFSGYKILVLWMLVVVFDHVRRLGWKKCDQCAVILLGLFLLPSLAHVRQTSIFAIVAGGLLPPLFPPEQSLHEIRAWKPWLHRFVVRSILVILPLIFAWRLMPSNQGFHLSYPPDTCPIKAVAFLRDKGLTGKLLVGYNSGSYALWELRGRMRVAMDGRYEIVYSYDTFAKIQRFFAGEDHWRDALLDPAPDAVLVNLPDPVYPKMLGEPGWKQAYSDSTHAVFLPRRDD